MNSASARPLTAARAAALASRYESASKMPKAPNDQQVLFPFADAPVAPRPPRKPATPKPAPALAPAPAPAAPAPAPAPRPKPPAPAEPEVLTVARLDRIIKRVLEGTTMDVLVRGEIVGLRTAGSGHLYFSLRDEREDACIDCVMYRTAPPRARKRVQNGERVVIRGQVTFYAPRGRIQFIAEDVLQTARGALLEALEELKKKLAAEGLFDPARKQPLPRDPRVVAVVTSRDGAAIHDIVRVAFRRGRVRLILVPTPVQGIGAAERIAAGIVRADRLRPDAIIVARGGGSADDLAAYNDEIVVRAIGVARAPVVSAIGHEIDVSLADLAADARAATPSQAAEMLVPDWNERASALEHLGMRLERAMHHRLATRRERVTRLRGRLGEPRALVLEQAQHVDELYARLERAARKILGARRARLETQLRRIESQHPRRVLAAARVRLGPLEPRLAAAMRARLEKAHHLVRDAAGRLDAMSPLAVLGRGYAIATRPDGAVVTDAATVAEGDQLDVRLHRGHVRTRVSGGE